jgi:hypothetical protein
LRRGVIDIVFALEFLRDRGAQLRDALDARVLISPRRIAAMAASLMLSGVSKSGSPAARPMTSRPPPSARAPFGVMASVGEGLMRSSARAVKPGGKADIIHSWVQENGRET